MIEISLTQHKVALIDDEDSKLLPLYSWKLTKGRNTFYVDGYSKSRLGKREWVRLHRLILKAKPNQKVDHINGNGLDNRRENLRICTTSQNGANRQYGYGKSKYKGLTWKDNSWQIQIRVNNKSIYLGRNKDEIEAAKIYDAAATKYFGEFAKLNFEKCGG